MMTLTEKVNALLASDISAYRIGKDTGVTTSAISETRKGNRKVDNLQLSVAEKLGAYWDKELSEMSSEAIAFVLRDIFKEFGVGALVTIEDMGDGAEAIVAEIDLPSGDTVRFAVNKANDPITKYDVLTALSYAMDDYDHEEDGVLFPSQPVEGADRPLVDAEFMSVSKEDADYLSDLSSKIFKARK